MIAGSATSRSPQNRTRSLLRALTAPWRGLIQPVQAAKDLSSASGFAFATTLVLHTLVLASAFVAFRMWLATVDPILSERDGARLLSAIEVWRAWHIESNFGVAEQTLLWVSSLVIVVTVFVTWLLFPYAHMGGSLWKTYRRTFRAAVSCAGVVILIVVAHAVLFACVTHVFVVAPLVAGTMEDSLPIAVIIAALPGSVCLITWWTSRVVRLTRPPVPASDPPPRCEGCGYDLTHRPDSGRCPECAYALDDSLTPDRKRTGCRWENRRGLRAWWATTFAVLWGANRFYATLRVRTSDDDARAFARSHYVLIGCVAGCCFLLGLWPLLSVSPLVTDPVVALPIATLFAWPLLAWLALHINVTMVVFWWAARGSRLRLYLTRKILCYEAAYLSLISIIAALFFASLFKFGLWPTQLFGRDFFASAFGKRAEVAIVIASVAVACGLWQWRITIAIRAIRWSNF